MLKNTIVGVILGLIIIAGVARADTSYVGEHLTIISWGSTSQLRGRITLKGNDARALYLAMEIPSRPNRVQPASFTVRNANIKTGRNVECAEVEPVSRTNDPEYERNIYVQPSDGTALAPNP